MLMCPNGHQSEAGNFCAECGGALAPAPSLVDNSVLMRSQVINVNSGQIPAQAPAIVKCSKCGQRNPESETFDCMGRCGRVNLCPRHFDAEYEVRAQIRLHQLAAYRAWHFGSEWRVITQ